jgi:hypothetical protein
VDERRPGQWTQWLAGSDLWHRFRQRLAMQLRRRPTVMQWAALLWLIGAGVLLFLRLGLSWIDEGLETRRQIAVSPVWPTTNGVVTASTVDTHIPRNPRYDPDYLPRVIFAYAVDGRTYRGERLWPGRAVFGTYNEARRVVERYPRGQPVTVYYDPDDPATAVLEPGGDWTRWLHRIVLGTFFTAMGSIMVGVAAWSWWTLGQPDRAAESPSPCAQGEGLG